MTTIASSRDARLLAAVARYAETKCLFGGVASSQGISLKGDNMLTSYRSAMRVVDDPGDRQFPRASTCIPDVSASDWAKFKKELDKAMIRTTPRPCRRRQTFPSRSRPACSPSTAETAKARKHHPETTNAQFHAGSRRHRAGI
jgi:hypothetical protein